MISGNVCGQRLCIAETFIVSDTINYLTAEFEFDNDWNDCAKYAHFVQDDIHVAIELTDNKIREEDGLNLPAGVWLVHIHGEQKDENGEVIKRIPTNTEAISVQQSGIEEGDPFPISPKGEAVRLWEAIEGLIKVMEELAENGGAVQSVNGKTGEVELNAEDVGALPVDTEITEVPDKVSAFENDAGYLKSFTETDPTVPLWAKMDEKPTYTPDEIGAEPNGTASSAVSTHNVDDLSHNDIRLLINTLTERLNALADSDDTTLDQMSEIVAYIKSNKELLYDVTTNKISYANVIDNLVTNVGDKPLSAAQGVVLKTLVDTLSTDINNELLKKADVEDVNNKLFGKSNTGHTHDDLYYGKSVIDAYLNNKSNAGHTHDDRYFAKQEMTDALNAKQDSLNFDTTPIFGSSNPVTSDGIKNAVSEVIEIAYGRKKAYVFDTVADLDSWLSFPINTAMLSTGDAFYIREVNSPDYWWDAETSTKQILETTKVDLSEYASIVYVNDELAKKAEIDHIHDDRYNTKQEVADALSDKADLVEGKVPKTQLPDDIGVQADWNETDEDSPAFVKNKTHGIVAGSIGYTFNADGSYVSIDPTKDHILQDSSEYFVRMIWTTSDLLSADDVVDTTATYVISDGATMTKEKKTITSDMVMKVTDKSFVAIDSYGSPLLMCVDEDVAGTEVMGMPVPPNVGTYLLYSYSDTPVYRCVVKFGSGNGIKTLDPMFLPPVNELKGFTEEINKVITATNNHNTDTSAHNDIRSILSTLNQKLEAFLNTDDTTLDQLSEIVAYIKNNKTLIDNITSSKVNVSDIINNLTTNVTNKPLSAAQGVALKALIDAITVPTKTSQLTNDSGFLTQHQSLAAYAKTADLAKVATSGSYNDLSNKPTIPTIPSSLPANGGNADTVDGFHIVKASSAPTTNNTSIITIVI